MQKNCDLCCEGEAKELRSSGGCGFFIDLKKKLWGSVAVSEVHKRDLSSCGCSIDLNSCFIDFKKAVGRLWVGVAVSLALRKWVWPSITFYSLDEAVMWPVKL